MRRKARELVFKVLFSHAVGQMGYESAWAHATQSLEASEREPYDDALDEAGLEFARKLLDGYCKYESEVDKALQETIEGWSFGQMAKTDLTILRLATYEMLFEPTPHAPLIEVAVKIAKRYGGEDSGRFVNGVLAKMLRRVEMGELVSVAKSD